MTRLIYDDARKVPPLQVIGGKARSFFRLGGFVREINKEYEKEGIKRRVEIPPFFVVPADFNLKDRDIFLKALESLEGETVAVRSSSALENDDQEHSFDGVFETMLDVAQKDIVDAIEQVRTSAITEKARRYAVEKGISLDERMPVIVQAMAQGTDRGTVYSKFPAPPDITKVNIKTKYDNKGWRYDISIFSREFSKRMQRYFIDDYVLINHPKTKPVESRWWTDPKRKIAEISLDIENRYKQPVSLEFIINPELEKYVLLQMRRIRGIQEAEEFIFPQLQEKGFIGKTALLSGVGNIQGPALVIRGYVGTHGVLISGEEISEFDRTHQDGYVLVTPYLQFYEDKLDNVTPHKTGVVVYTELSLDHDFDLARSQKLLYVNVGGLLKLKEEIEIDLNSRGMVITPQFPIKTGDVVHIVSDGLQAYISNLSREVNIPREQ